MALENIPTQNGPGFSKNPTGNTLDAGPSFSYGGEPAGDRYQVGPGVSQRYASPTPEPPDAPEPSRDPIPC